MSTSQPWRFSPTVALVSVVNVRFFRFQRPVLLAVIVGGLTLALSIALGATLRFQTCNRWSSTITVPFIEPNAECSPSSQNSGWIKSTYVADSSATFTATSGAVYTDNYMNMWKGWLDALSLVINDTRLSSVDSTNAPFPISSPKVVHQLQVPADPQVSRDAQAERTVDTRMRRLSTDRHALVFVLQSKYTASTVPEPAELLQACPDLQKPQRPLYMNELAVFKHLKPADFPALRTMPYGYLQVNRTLPVPGDAKATMLQTCEAWVCANPKAAIVYNCAINQEVADFFKGAEITRASLVGGSCRVLVLRLCSCCVCISAVTHVQSASSACLPSSGHHCLPSSGHHSSSISCPGRFNMIGLCMAEWWQPCPTAAPGKWACWGLRFTVERHSGCPAQAHPFECDQGSRHAADCMDRPHAAVQLAPLARPPAHPPACCLLQNTLAAFDVVQSLQMARKTLVPTCCHHYTNGQGSWCATPAMMGFVASITLTKIINVTAGTSFAEQILPFGMSPEMQRLLGIMYKYQSNLAEQCARMDNMTMEEAKTLLHLQMTAYTAVAADMIANQPTFQRDLRQSLLNAGLQCNLVQCMPWLSVVGIALSYLVWLEFLACMLVLAVYVMFSKDERNMMEQVPAIAIKAAELPGHPDHKGDWFTTPLRAARVSHKMDESMPQHGPIPETRDGSNLLPSKAVDDPSVQ
jgi:hypothetical protein